jgi:hypothetical protein
MPTLEDNVSSGVRPHTWQSQIESSATNGRKFKLGDWVEVRSKEEILRTLDSEGRLEGMPFMPEMFKFCGQRFQVYKRAHKTCDPDMTSRRIPNAIHLKTRCDGRDHGGCQAGCSIFWKDAWLKPSGDAASSFNVPREDHSALIQIGPSAGGCTEAVVRDRTQVQDPDGGVSYVCQTTHVQYEKLLPWWDLRQYFEDLASGNIGLGRLISGGIYSLHYHVTQAGIGLGPIMRWIYDAARPLWRGSKWPRHVGTIPEGEPTPTVSLNLQPGEFVRVKSHDEILKTINTGSKNRGLWWDAELVPYCGKTFRVADRVTRVLDEKTGKMQVMKNPSIILDSAYCGARYSACRMFCPRETYAYWREIWLERVSPPVDVSEDRSLVSTKR